jgi:tRNA U34 5-methylaminomethyl-2-thiouridine-forming methyltransferase MnmC
LNRVVTTYDGSDTIYVPGLDEHYHSIHGAVQESSFIFLNNGFDICRADPVNIFEVGFGTGLNALLTAVRAMNGQKTVNYTAIEKYPLSTEVAGNLNYPDFAGPAGKDIFRRIHRSPWEEPVTICNNFNLTKVRGDITSDRPAALFDIIYFDAFSPEKQPEMWSEEIFSGIAAITAKGGILVTYSAKGQVKRTLAKCGFIVSLIPGPPGKRQIIRAIKI